MTTHFFTAQQMLQDILKFTDYTLTEISAQTGISRSTLSRIYHDCASIVHLRNFNKLLRLYCQLVANKQKQA